MLKRLALLLAILLWIPSVCVYAISNETVLFSKPIQFHDVKKGIWYYDYVNELLEENIIHGDGTGYFKPKDTLTYNQYLKMVVAAITYETYSPVNGKWEKPYIDKAIELGLINSYEKTDYNVPINRYDMAKVIVKACNEEFKDYEKYAQVIKDFDKIPSDYVEYVLKAYSKGFIEGFPDGTFDGDSIITRSQSVAVVARLLDPLQRKTPKEVTIIEVPISSSTKITDDKPILAICDKYKYGLMGLSDGPVYDYKKYEKPGFIEPIILLREQDTRKWLGFSLLNRNEYVNKGYKVKFECVSDPEYVKVPEWENILYNVAVGLNLPLTAPGSESGKEVLYEISISNGSMTKVYPFSIILGGGVNE